MAQIIWTDSALSDLNQIAEYIALDKPNAAKSLIQKAFNKVEQLEQFPESGRIPSEIKNLAFLEIVINPCRIFYRYELETDKVYILYVMRSERDLRRYLLGQI